MKAQRQAVVRALRLARAWSQEQLAELVSVSVRPLQRSEKGEPPSLESQAHWPPSL
ncbi:helix-turn-helix domain-containing protein [Cronobacter muytjensii]|uniref:helix-turn-helix domain-containing protein n=1 Tax=Cronobacter muytjensii TaxID=413501 RepID=UPI003F66E156